MKEKTTHGFTLSSFSSTFTLSLFLRLLKVNTMIPPSMNITPMKLVTLKLSPNRKTPNNVAVKGSASESVTAEEGLIFSKPAKNNT